MPNHRKSAPDEAPRLPVKLEPASNGEYVPRPEHAATRAARRLACARVAENARRLGISRRDLLSSACGAATVLLALNATTGCTGGRYALSEEAAFEEDAAHAALSGDDFIFDVQTHHVNPAREWADDNYTIRLLAYAAPYKRCGDARWLDCFSREHYLREVFLHSDTDVAVLSVVPGHGESDPLTHAEMLETRALVDKLDGSKRLLLHGYVAPQLHTRQSLFEHMAALKEDFGVAAFKLYPIGGPDGDGYWLDDPARGVPVFENARALGVRTIAVHKGLPLPFTDARYARCGDVGPIAKLFPDIRILVYHAGFEPLHEEGPFDPDGVVGVDGLLHALRDSGIGKGGNVWVDLGSTWRQLMPRPDELAHVMGKLLVHLGEDRILWGTDAIWYGSPQDQIQAFRAFEIGAAYQERFGYPPLSRTAKAKILGGNAAAVYGLDADALRAEVRGDQVARARAEPGVQPTFSTYGPTTRRDLLTMWRRSGALR